MRKRSSSYTKPFSVIEKSASSKTTNAAVGTALGGRNTLGADVGYELGTVLGDVGPLLGNADGMMLGSEIGAGI